MKETFFFKLDALNIQTAGCIQDLITLVHEETYQEHVCTHVQTHSVSLCACSSPVLRCHLVLSYHCLIRCDLEFVTHVEVFAWEITVTLFSETSQTFYGREICQTFLPSLQFNSWEHLEHSGEKMCTENFELGRLSVVSAEDFWTQVRFI